MEFLLAAKHKSRLFEQSARAVLSLGHLKHRLFPLALEFTNQSVVSPPFPPSNVTSISTAIFSVFRNIWIKNKSRLVLKY